MNIRKLNSFSLTVILILSLTLIASPINARNGAILYVKEGASGDCASWATACDLQTALGLADSGYQVWVGAGTYKPTSGTDRSLSFQLESGVEVYGGFPALGGDWTSRDPSANLTTLSGDLGVVGTDTDNSYHVVSGNGVDDTAILDGFTISGGYANGNNQDYFGGGIINYNASSPTLTNLIITGNRGSQWGGGMYNLDSSNPTLTNVTFSGNRATAGCGMANSFSNPTLNQVTFSDHTLPCNSGGGMYNSSSSPILNDVTFSNNTVSNSGSGMYNSGTSTDPSNPTLFDVTFSHNIAGSNSSDYGDGGGIYNMLSSPTLISVTISNNTTKSDGGGMYNYSGSNPTLIDVAFEGNVANDKWGGGGGGMYNYNSDPTLTLVTFTGNQATFNEDECGGGMYNDASSPTLTDVTFSSNSTKKSGGGMYNEGTYTDPSSPSLTRVVFSGNTTAEGLGTYGGGMFNGDWCSPLLTDVSFTGNRSGYHGGGMYSCQVTHPNLNRVTFSGNSAHDDGGGMYNTANNPSLTNVTFSGNWVDAGSGGGMYNSHFNVNPTFTNLTFYGNSDGFTGGGGMFNSGDAPTIIHAIFWGNDSFLDSDQIAGPANITYSDIQGGYSGTGNIDLDPLLGPLANNGGFTQTHALGAGSPAIDAGSTDPVYCPTTDQRGYFRPQDGDGNGTRICDMGAYEYGTTLWIYLPTIMK